MPYVLMTYAPNIVLYKVYINGHQTIQTYNFDIKMDSAI
jgi:hypothetical protein